MRIKFPNLLPLAIALVATASTGFATELDLWFTPLSSEGPMKVPMSQTEAFALSRSSSRSFSRSTTAKTHTSTTMPAKNG